MTYEIERLLPRHYAVMNLVLEGLDDVAIAKVVGMSRGSVGMIRRSPLFQDELARQRERVNDNAFELDRQAMLGKARSILDQAATKAALVQEQLLTSDDDSVKLRSSQSILDRVFGKDDKTSSGVVNNITLSGPDAKLLVLALQESKHGNRKDVQTTNGSKVCPGDSEEVEGDVYETSGVGSEGGRSGSSEE